MKHRIKRQFTLTELLVVIAIISILATMLLPVLTNVRALAKRIKCISNLKQLGAIAHFYLNDYDERFPLASDGINSWDVAANGKDPGILYSGGEDYTEIQQCPAFGKSQGSDNAKHTGYNYNTTYVGHGVGETIVAPAKLSFMKKPSACALFGDGEYVIGGVHDSDKFMRAPDAYGAAPARRFAAKVSDVLLLKAGTQGYRHLGKTNVGWGDGHADTWGTICKNHPNTGLLGSGTGFLDDNDDPYDLE